MRCSAMTTMRPHRNPDLSVPPALPDRCCVCAHWRRSRIDTGGINSPPVVVHAGQGARRSRDHRAAAWRAGLCDVRGRHRCSARAGLTQHACRIERAYGGLEGRTLEAGDVVPIGRSPHMGDGRFDFGVTPPDVAIIGASPADDRVLRIRVMRAGECDLFSGGDAACVRSTTWKISARSDRGGYRLTGGKLTLDAPVEMRSHGVVVVASCRCRRAASRSSR